jgi:hypothetical protein
MIIESNFGNVLNEGERALLNEYSPRDHYRALTMLTSIFKNINNMKREFNFNFNKQNHLLTVTHDTGVAWIFQLKEEVSENE